MAAPSRRYQFGLRALLAVMAAISLSLAGRALLRQQLARQDYLSCRSRLAHLSILLQTYHDYYDAFPPSYLVDESGSPNHSWRTLILFGYNPRFPPPYKLNEPWDGPNNGKFTSGWKDDFVCPSAGHDWPQPVTDYAMVVGPGAISAGETLTALEEIVDGPENTVIVMELVDSDIGWGEPRDISLDDAVQALTGGPQKQIAGPHRGRMLLFADGETRRLTRPLPEATARALLTVSGGEAVKRYELDDAGYFN